MAGGQVRLAPRYSAAHRQSAAGRRHRPHPAQLDVTSGPRCAQFEHPRESQTESHLRAGWPVGRDPARASRHSGVATPGTALRSVFRGHPLGFVPQPHRREVCFRCTSNPHACLEDARTAASQRTPDLRPRRLLRPVGVRSRHTGQRRRHHAPIAVIVVAGFPNAGLHIASASSESLPNNSENGTSTSESVIVVRRTV